MKRVLIAAMALFVLFGSPDRPAHADEGCQTESQISCTNNTPCTKSACSPWCNGESNTSTSGHRCDGGTCLCQCNSCEDN